jgi:uncharacterized membrane protein
MAPPNLTWTEEQVEAFIGNLLRWGVITAASVVLAGAAIYLARHATDPADHGAFQREPRSLTNFAGILNGVADLRGRAVIQLGLLILIATPIARVLFSILAFARQRAWTYVVITSIVLALLFASLLSGARE